MAQLIECPPVHQPAGLIPGQGMDLDFGFDPQLGHICTHRRPTGSGYRVKPQVELCIPSQPYKTWTAPTPHCPAVTGGLTIRGRATNKSQFRGQSSPSIRKLDLTASLEPSWGANGLWEMQQVLPKQVKLRRTL